MTSLNLKQLVLKIREELEEIDRERKAKAKTVLLNLEAVELEIKFTITESETSKGGFDFRVFTASADDSSQAERAQTIRIQYRVARNLEGQSTLGGQAHSRGDHPVNDEIELVK